MATYDASQADVDLANRISGSWAAFARTGRLSNAESGSNLVLQIWNQGTKAGATGAKFQIEVLGGTHPGMTEISSTGTGGLYGTRKLHSGSCFGTRRRFWKSWQPDTRRKLINAALLQTTTIGSLLGEGGDPLMNDLSESLWHVYWMIMPCPIEYQHLTLVISCQQLLPQ